MRAERLCEMIASGRDGRHDGLHADGPGPAPRPGFLERSQYAGAAPVSLIAYVKQVKRSPS